MIIISPYARPLRNGKPHPKDYPCWKELIPLIDEPIVQVGVQGEIQLVPDFRTNLSLTDLAKLVGECKTWIAVDSFFQHFCWDLGKKGIVLFGQSNPEIFGHPENFNLFNKREIGPGCWFPYFREQQFWLWEQAEVIPEAFVKPEVVLEHLKKFL
jgi:ADP-heptose:LPS heptosyltransferase